MKIQQTKTTLLAGVALLLVIVFAVGSCTPTNQVAVDERPSSRPDTTLASSDKQDISADLSFDPLGAQGDVIIVPEALRDSVTYSLTNLALDSTFGLENPSEDSTILEIALSPDTIAYDTYRIQLFNSRVYTEAALERSIATEIFDYTVTLDYEVPYFKVRIGDFPDAKVAREYLKDYVKPAGYPDSWVARVRVTPQKSAEAQALLTAYFDSLRTAILMEGLDLETLDSLGVLDSLFADSLLGDTLSDTTNAEDVDE